MNYPGRYSEWPNSTGMGLPHFNWVIVVILSHFGGRREIALSLISEGILVLPSTAAACIEMHVYTCTVHHSSANKFCQRYQGH